MDAANATYSCIWCKCPSSTRHDLTKKWSITNPEEGAQSIKEIQECAGKSKTSQFSKDVKDWLDLFLSVYQAKQVTPYIHLLSSHFVEFLKLYGSLAPFSQPGLEKLNDHITQYYFKSTNHSIDSLTQIMRKLNRLE